MTEDLCPSGGSGCCAPSPYSFLMTLDIRRRSEISFSLKSVESNDNPSDLGLGAHKSLGTNTSDLGLGAQNPRSPGGP